MRIDPKLIPVFSEVKESHSFTKAAEALGVSVPRVSLLIARLERQVGFRLFDRTSWHVRLTEQGEGFARAIEGVERALADLDREIDEHRRPKIPLIKVGAPFFTRNIPMRVRLIDEFIAREPQVTLEVDNSPALSALAKLKRGELDFAIVGPPFDSQGVEYLVLTRSRSLIAVPVEDRLADMRCVTPADIRARKLVVLPRRVAARFYRGWPGAWEDFGAELVEAPEGSVISPLHFAGTRRFLALCQWLPADAGEVATKARMVLKPLEGPQGSLEVYLCRRTGSPPSHQQIFWDFARDLTQEIVVETKTAGAI